MHGIVRIIGLLFLALLAFTAMAERYEYDPTGQLRSIVRDDGTTLNFVYDAAGNLLSVSPQAPEGAVIHGIDPDTIRRGQSGSFVIDGIGLAGATVVSPTTDLAISDVAASESSISFQMSADLAAELGPRALNVLVPGEPSAQVSVEVLSAGPVLSVTPTPIAIPPDGQTYGYGLRLSEADTVDWTVALSVDSPDITVNPPSAVIPAGSLTAPFQLASATEGVYRLTIEANGHTQTLPVFVTSEYRGINFAVAPLVGVTLAGGGGSAEAEGIVTAPLVGVSVGPLVRAITPDALERGTTQALAFSGAGLATADALSVMPADGVSVLEVAADADGRRVVATVAVDAFAPLGTRRVKLLHQGMAYPAWDDRVLVADPAPRITGLLPHYVERGESTRVRVSGENLAQATGVAVSPATYVSAAIESVAADGRSMWVQVGATALAAEGPRTLIVTTPSGASDGTPSPANTFWVTDRDPPLYTPIMAPLVGVNLGDGPVGPEVQATLVSPAVGVTLGSTITARSPAAWGRGQSIALGMLGQGLSGVDGLSVTPAAGVSIQGLAVGADGRSVTADITVAADAALGMRRLHLTRAGVAIPFATAELATVHITTPLPAVTGVSPNRVGPGSVQSLRVVGSHLGQVTAVTAVPGGGLSLGVPTLAADGGSLTVPLAVTDSATPGERAIVLHSPAGASSAVPTVANTVTVTENTPFTVSPLMAPLVGVTLGEAAGGGSTEALIMAPLVGVRVGEGGPGGSTELGIHTPQVGVAIGPAVFTAQASPLHSGLNGTVDLTGVGLDAIATADLVPQGQGVIVTGIATAADGRSARLTVEVSPLAETGPYALALAATGGQPIPLADPAAAVVDVAAAPPVVESISPIVGRPGETMLLTIRGTDLHKPTAVRFSPADGITVGSQFSASADGRTVTVPIHVNEDAALGARTLRIFTPGGGSDAASTPANTFTVYR